MNIKKLAKAQAYDKFVKDLEADFEQIKPFMSFLSLDEEERKRVDASLEILEKKIKKMSKVKSLKEAKKHVKMKKIYLDTGGDK